MFKHIVMTCAAELGVPLQEDQAELMEAYWRLLSERNRELNLTAIKEEDQAALLHFADSFALLKAWDMAGKRVLDVGTGGGFPGIPLKIACPDMELTVLDSTEKKIDFIREAAGRLGIELTCLTGRAEELALGPEHRDRYQVTVSRAVARLNILTELCLPLTAPGGAFIAAKSGGNSQETEEGRRAAGQLGGKVLDILEYSLPGDEVFLRRAIVIGKMGATPPGFPRRYARIKKAPL